MMGISLSKIVLTLAVLAGVWWVWRRLAHGAAVGRRPDAQGVPRQEPAARQALIEEMVACPVCGTFVAREGASRCARGNCPY